MPHLFRPYADSVARVVLLALVMVPLLAIGLGFWVTASEYVTQRTLTLDQPVPFSHQHHAGGLGIDCRYCHTGAETAAVAGVPTTQICMTCHSQLYTQTAMLAPIRESLARGQPIHWNRVHRLPDYVYFDHSIHIAKGVGCSSCHGDVSTMPLMRQTARLTMGWCLDCHRNPAPNLRAAADLFDPAWQAPDDQDLRGALLARHNIDNTHLTDCSVCHR